MPGVSREHVLAAADRVRAESSRSRGGCVPIEYMATLLMPSDEVVFHLFRSSSAEAVREMCARAGLAFERVLASEYLAAGTADA